jgi:hypothetical protein
MLVIPALWKAELRELQVKSSPRQKAQDPVWKITKAERCEMWDVAQMVEHFSKKGEALSSNSIYHTHNTQNANE